MFNRVIQRLTFPSQRLRYQCTHTASITSASDDVEQPPLQPETLENLAVVEDRIGMYMNFYEYHIPTAHTVTYSRFAFSTCSDQQEASSLQPPAFWRPGPTV